MCTKNKINKLFFNHTCLVSGIDLLQYEGLFEKTILILARRLGFRIDMFTLGDSPLLCLGVLIRNPDMHTGTCSAIESFLIL